MSELLPIGSVVRVHGSPTTLLVIGYGPISEETKRHYDYLAANYPFGLGGNMQTLMFDREVIDEVLYSGYTDEESDTYRNVMDKLIKKG